MRTILRRYNPNLFLALALALAYHGALLLTGTYKGTYDAYVHIFFADHYARAWFDHWEPRWYTGFPMVSYPPGSQQSIALLSYLVGLQNGFVIVATFAVLNVTLGIYRFSQIWVSEEAAGYAALLTVFASCIAETVHVFGQLPTMFSLGFLLNALPFVYHWMREGRLRWLITAWLLNAATTAGHHVTTLFGAVFFVAPVIALAIVEALRQPLPDEPGQHPALITRKNVRALLARRARRALPALTRAAIYGPGLIIALVLVVLPYWLWSKNDPINQVTIPHASRDSFIKNTAAGLVFWLVPYGLSLLVLPYVLYKGLTTRAWPMALSWALLFFLGTGGTTPYPKMLLGGSFDVLTLDRFTFWATITQLPLLGEFVVSLRHGRLARYTREQFGDITWRLVQISLVVAYLLISIFVANLTKFRKFQPDPINTQPIATFLEKDEHWRWRYLTLGFGDQMAWLSAQTSASSVDGNYHSARRLPEMTSTPVERLEGAKYSGVPGIGSLQQFLAVPEKYNLKFIFSNDQFYDPLLFFSGWHRLQRLENGIMVWEREDIPPMPEAPPRKEIPYYQRVMWGVVPMSAITAALIAFAAPVWWPYLRWLFSRSRDERPKTKPRWAIGRRLLQRSGLPGLWFFVLRLAPALNRRLLAWSALPAGDDSPQVRWQVWLGWASRLPRPRPATPTAQHVRLALLTAIGLAGAASAAGWYRALAHTPTAVVQGYYDDLDFRRFSMAYERLDPQTRPGYDQYLIDLSVQGGMVASYGKLNNVRVTTLAAEPERVTLVAATDWVTSLSSYSTTQTLTLVRRDGQWYIEPDPVDNTVPPEQFFRRGEVGYVAAGRRRVTNQPTSFNDILDRPDLQVLSARLVKHNGRYSVVGELINNASDPADATVTAFLRDADGQELIRYNAQEGMVHKLLPKEATPFRVDFEGVAGAVLSDTLDLKNFKPGAFTPPILTRPIGSFGVYAKGVATQRDLDRGLTLQNLQVQPLPGGGARLTGQLLNTGTHEATIPHVLLTYYDARNQVVWVDHVFIRDAVRPQHMQQIDIALTPYGELQPVLGAGDLLAAPERPDRSAQTAWRERIALPPGLGYAALRVSVHAFEGSAL
ncbi:hypothetical protein [Kouleothrix sp.]|uniref:hypothetical protein n=1 Tax=Kouleothrix sp. TaxID=2779161 RepID=UPI00391BCC11